MPKISESQRELRRRHFLEAAWRCFSRNGVAATSMDDITREAHSSAGSLYLYFATKNDLIRAAITSSVDDFDEMVAATVGSPAAATYPLFVATLLDRTESFGTRSDTVDLFALAVQGWAHAQGDPEAARIIRVGYSRILKRFAQAASAWGAAPDDARRLATLIGSIVLGFVAQKALGIDRAALEHSSVVALLGGRSPGF